MNAKITTAILTLAAKSAGATAAIEAMQFSQSALNLAHMLVSLRLNTQPKDEK